MIETNKRAGRPWYAGPLLVAGTAASVVRSLRSRKMGALVPIMISLYIAAIVLYLINLVSPLAPFVYSLF